MKKIGLPGNRLFKQLAFSLLAVTALAIASSSAVADDAAGRSRSANPSSKVAMVSFQDQGRSDSKTPLSQVFTFGSGLLLAAFLVRAHARMVLKKSARM